MTDTSVATALEKIKDAPLHEVGGEAPPPAWDWRAEGVMPAVRDQGPVRRPRWQAWATQRGGCMLGGMCGAA